MNDRRASPGGLSAAGSVRVDVERVQQLRTIGLFGALDDEQLEHLARSLPIVDHGADEVVFREGDEGRALYVVVAGTLVATKNTTSGKERHLAELGPGEWFGEMSLLDVMPRPVTITTTSATQLQRLIDNLRARARELLRLADALEERIQQMLER